MSCGPRLIECPKGAPLSPRRATCGIPGHRTSNLYSRTFLSLPKMSTGRAGEMATFGLGCSVMDVRSCQSQPDDWIHHELRCDLRNGIEESGFAVARIEGPPALSAGTESDLPG